ncbi:Kinesin-like protein [Phytophthora cactorum]|nr:Kinesin-like protein [Phytophthora cactorum]
MTAHRVIFGRNVIQVPLKQSQTHEYVNLVLSQLEFDAMAVHVPQYEEFPPEEILERITQLLKEQEGKKRQRLGSSSSITSTDQTDSIAAFQGRLLELEYERKRLHTKLKGAKALQINLTEENTALRVQLEQAEQQAIDIEELFQENELLRYQTLHLGSDVAKWKNVAMKTVQELRTLKQELIALKDQVKNDRDEIALTVEDAMAMIVEDVSRREQVLQQSYLAEKREREVMAEKYYELSGRIRVFCRLRPAKEIEDEAKTPALEFAFDQVFGPHSTQAEVYTQVEPLVSSFTDGYNACIMAYGQTGSGKTHTMVGNERGPLEHRANGLTQVFAIVKKRQMTYVDSLRVSMVEIYNDQILDLLHEGSTGGGKNAVAKSETDITAREVSGYAQKHCTTKMNLESSRSHALVFLHLESQHRETREVRTSTLCLVDLAGSERISRSQVEGERLRETQHINKSLAALGDVVYALQHKAKHTPYRNSKLTYMLRDMLSGQAKTLLMLQLSPDTADVEETTCSLQFGARVSQEENRAFEAKTQAMETQLNALQRQCEQQGDELHEAHSSGKASDELEQDEFSPEARSPSPSRPPSPTPSAKSIHNCIVSATYRSTIAGVVLVQIIRDSSNLKYLWACDFTNVSTSTSGIDGRARGTTQVAIGCFSRPSVDPDLRRKSLSATSASRIANQDNRRNSLSTLQTRLMSGSVITGESVPLHPPARTRQQGHQHLLDKGVGQPVIEARSAKALDHLHLRVFSFFEFIDRQQTCTHSTSCSLNSVESTVKNPD